MMETANCNNCFVLFDEYRQLKRDYKNLRSRTKVNEDYIEELISYTNKKELELTQAIDRLKLEKSKLNRVFGFSPNS